MSIEIGHDHVDLTHFKFALRYHPHVCYHWPLVAAAHVRQQKLRLILIQQ
jgi:hypothetical protein